MNKIYGWFDDASQTEPSSDPPYDAPCLWCGHEITADDVRSPSMMYVGQYAARSYFYRVHRTCSERNKPKTMDGFVLDMIERNGD